MFFLMSSAIMFIIGFVVINYYVLPLQIPFAFKALFMIFIVLISQKMTIFMMFFRSAGFYKLPVWFMEVAGFLQIWLILLFLLLMVGLIVSIPLLFYGIEIPHLLSALFGLSILLTSVGIYNTFKIPAIKNVEVAVQTPVNFEPLKVIQLTDLHIGSGFGKPWLEKVVAKTNAQNPDVILITGDTIDGYPDELVPQLAPLKDLKAKYGVFMVLGNHEFYFGAKRWTDAFEKMDIPVLHNEHIVIREGKDTVVIGGLPALELNPDAVKTFETAPKYAPRILMAHYPRGAVDNAKAGVALQLSGHTHGGQLFWPVNQVVAAANGGYLKGMYDVNGMKMYVSNGTGLWGGFPVRLMTPSEITVIDFKRSLKQ